MAAFEFFSTAEDGIIRIPEAFQNKKRFKVTVMDEENPSSIRELLIAPTLDTRGMKFDREQANER